MRKHLLAALLVLLPLAAQAQEFIRYYPPSGTTFTGGTITTPLAAPAADNCAAIPYSFTGDTNTGLCTSAADTFNLYTAGVSRLSGNSTAVTSTVPYVGTTTGNSIALCNTADCTTNYERMFFNWSSNYAMVESQSGGSGTARDLVLKAPTGKSIYIQVGANNPIQAQANLVTIQGSSVPSTDANYALGSTTSRWASAYLSGFGLQGSKSKALTDNVATAFATMAMPQTAGSNYGGGKGIYTIFCKDATNQATETGEFHFACHNLAGTEACTVGAAGAPTTNIILGDGTASFVAPVFTAAAGADLVTFSVQSDCSGVTPTTHTIEVRFDLPHVNTLAFP